MNWLRYAKLGEMQLSDGMREHLECWKLRDGAIYFSGGHKLRKANLATFEIVDDEHSYLARDDSHVFHGWSLLKFVDRDSFKYLGDRYYCDNNLAYFEFENSLKPLKGARVDDFRVLGYGYARDSSFGYFSGKPVKQCTSPMSLQIVEVVDDKSMAYAFDDDHVYCEAAVLKGADVDTWQPSVRGFSTDKSSVFYFADRLSKADVASWQHLASCYSRDQKQVFYMTRPLKNADPKSWKLIDDNYSADGIRVYFSGKAIDGADAESFEVTSDGKARDRFGEFDGGSRLAGSSS